MQIFVKRIVDLRSELPDNHMLFLDYLNKNQRLPRSIQLKTEDIWLESTMEEAGIDAKEFKAHSLRTTASTRTVFVGIQIGQVKLYSNWSMPSRMFNDYYYKEINTNEELT